MLQETRVSVSLLSGRAFKRQTLLSATPSLAPQNAVAKDLSEAPCLMEANGKRSLHTSNASPEKRPPGMIQAAPAHPPLGVSTNSPLL